MEKRRHDKKPSEHPESPANKPYPYTQKDALSGFGTHGETEEHKRHTHGASSEHTKHPGHHTHSGLEQNVDERTIQNTAVPWQSPDHRLSNAWQDAPSSVMATQADNPDNIGLAEGPLGHEVDLSLNYGDDIEVADLETGTPATRSARPRGRASNIVWPEPSERKRRRES